MSKGNRLQIVSLLVSCLCLCVLAGLVSTARTEMLPGKSSQLRKKISQLDPDTSTRISIEADRTNESSTYAYDFYANRLETVW